MNVDQEYDVIFKQAVRMADQLKVESIITRDAKKQIHWENVPVISPEEYKKWAFVKLIVGSIISEITHSFDKFYSKVVELLILTSSVLCFEKCKENVDISTILEEDEDDLINRDIMDQESLLWQRKWLTVASKDRPCALSKTITKYVRKYSLTCSFCWK